MRRVRFDDMKCFNSRAFVLTRILGESQYRWLPMMVRLIPRTSVSTGDSGATTRRHTSFR
ncbi:hypothetical protein C1H46_005551 [Malus baccata]|uniref:Uncharacterized protein n=1 Tax=Malus baccata TaxID=106549 RepID=A0A540NE04_MALBA|nr:hypothetical protein C1H46_005551 [Malus baccata]